MENLGQMVRTTVPGARVFCWDLGNLTAAEARHPCIGGGGGEVGGARCSGERVWASSSNIRTPLQTQVETLMERVRGTAALEDGFSLFGYSQGGVLARALVQMRPSTWGNRWAPRVLVTLDSPHAGVALAPAGDHGLAARLLRDDYEHEVQGKELTPLDFAKDCERIGTYYSSSWLAALNNEVPGRRRAEYAERLRRLRAMVLLASAHDGIVYPTASQTLAFLPCDPVLGASLNDTFDGDGAAERGAAIDDGGTDVLSRPLQAIGGPDGQVELPLGALGSGLALRRTLSYREDLLGVRSLDEAGRLHFAEHSWHHSGMLAPSQRTRRFFDAHVAPHLTLTAADATQAEAEEREREAGGLRQTAAAALQPVFR